MEDFTPPLSEHLPGEPEPRKWTLAAITKELGKDLLITAVVGLLGLPLWPLYLVLSLFLPRPPILPSMERYLRFFGLLFSVTPPSPGLPWYSRLGVGLLAIQRLMFRPFLGLAWYLDLLLYGRALQATTIHGPFFEISAARSGSTQLAHYLEDDPHICAPNVLQSGLPFVWAWHLVPALLGRRFPEERVRELFLGMFERPYLERHEMDPLRTDTFEVIFMALQLGDLFACLGPQPIVDEYRPDTITPECRSFWEEDFMEYLDAIGRRTLLYAQQTGTGGRSLMIKGHFLAVAGLLEEKYPDARFLTVLRAPEKRIQSVINFWRCNPSPTLMGPIPWSWLVKRVLDVELDYCDAEMGWYQQEGPGRRVVVRFDDFVADLEGTLRQVYRECLDLDEVPAHLPRTHPPRKRSHYSVDRSLEQLSISPEWLKHRLEGYRRWCSGRKAS